MTIVGTGTLTAPFKKLSDIDFDVYWSVYHMGNLYIIDEIFSKSPKIYSILFIRNMEPIPREIYQKHKALLYTN